MTPATVLITGASSGLGRGLALHYARAGATVHALARRRQELDSLAAEAQRASAGRIVPTVLDVTDAEAGGALDLVIANAGLGDPTPARRIDWRKVKRIMDVNVSAACVTIAAALPAMVARGQGTVVAVASLAAYRGFPEAGAYCASKAALHTFMESMRVDLRGSGVKAITVYPGFVRTEMTARNKFRMPFMMELDDAIRVMARGIDRGSSTVAFPLPARMSVALIGTVPRAIYEPLANPRRYRSKRGS